MPWFHLHTISHFIVANGRKTGTARLCGKYVVVIIAVQMHFIRCALRMGWNAQNRNATTAAVLRTLWSLHEIDVNVNTHSFIAFRSIRQMGIRTETNFSFFSFVRSFGRDDIKRKFVAEWKKKVGTWIACTKGNYGNCSVVFQLLLFCILPHSERREKVLFFLFFFFIVSLTVFEV